MPAPVAIGSFRVAVKPHYSTAHIAFFQDQASIEKNGQMIGVKEIRCIVRFNGETFERSAYFSPDDEFDVYHGISLSFHRAMSAMSYANEPSKGHFVVSLSEKAIKERNRQNGKYPVYPVFVQPIVKRYRQFVARKKAVSKANEV